jgi:hypothetical protein
MRAANRDVERPVRKTLVNEMIFRDDSGRMPQADAIIPTNALGRPLWRRGDVQ